MPENWDDIYDDLARSRFLSHNDDYLEFLVAKVWRLDRPYKIIDFGCGYGFFGLKLLELLPEGSSYTGIDKTRSLLDKGKEIFSKLKYEYKFVHSDAHSVPLADSSFDLAVSHALLMHIEHAEKVINEMIRVTTNGGTVIVCEGNRLAHFATYFSSGSVQPPYNLGIMQTYYSGIKEKDGIDYDIGLKLPSIMHRAGLVNIGCRLSDCVHCHLPGDGNDDKNKRLYDTLSNEGYGLPIKDEDIEGLVQRYVKYGVPENEAHEYALHLQMQIDDFIANGRSYDLVYAGMMSISYGTVRK
jgi:ubiquinone/menaquinone biosynthesis C-methylase UbiE